MRRCNSKSCARIPSCSCRPNENTIYYDNETHWVYASKLYTTEGIVPSEMIKMVGVRGLPVWEIGSLVRREVESKWEPNDKTRRPCQSH